MGIQMELPDRKVTIKEKGWRYIFGAAELKHQNNLAFSPNKSVGLNITFCKERVEVWIGSVGQ